MNIISINPNPSGAYPPIQSWSGEVPPETHYEITADVTEYYNGFIIPTVENNVVTSFICNTELWEAWKTVPIEKLREDKLNSLDGMCSGAIYQGVDISGKHYSFTQTTQGNIKGMLIEAQMGRTTFLYCANNEPLTAYTAEQIKAIAQVMGEWINVNTAYYELLQKWVSRETDETVLDGIHYGSILPNDLIQGLATTLASVGIDVSKYTSLINP